MSGIKQWQNRIALVTGAAHGIGAAVTKDLLNAGIIVVGLDIDEPGLHKLHNSLTPAIRPRLQIIKCDVRDAKQVDAAFDSIEESLGGVDILINNAGIHVTGSLCTVSLTDAQDVMQTNVMQVLHCTQRTYQSLKKRHVPGHIIFLNSISGHSFRPLSMGVNNMYIPSKQALTAMNEVLRQEFRDEGLNIKVTNLCPGLVDTAMLTQAVRDNYGNQLLKVEDVSKTILYILDMPSHVQVHDVVIKHMGEAV